MNKKAKDFTKVKGFIPVLYILTLLIAVLLIIPASVNYGRKTAQIEANVTAETISTDSIPLNKVYIGLGGGKIFQFSNRVGAQMMSYLIETPDGRVVMVDSGHPEKEDALYMLDVIKEYGGTVDYWFISHAHNDHFGGLLWLMENNKFNEITVKEFCFSFPEIDWLKNYIDNEEEKDEIVRFLKLVSESGIPVKTVQKGDFIECGSMKFEVLNSTERYEEFDNSNDTSIVVRADFPRRSVLFLGDTSVKSGERLLKECDARKLRCDIVQMAHHGQDGVNKEFYEKVMPKICLYPTPDWLWNCDNGGGYGSGPWKTLETRAWMEELGVQVSCPAAYGDYILE